MRAGFEGSQDHDFWLRASERAAPSGTCRRSCITGGSCPARRRSPGIASRPASRAGRRAVEEAFHRRGLACRVEHPTSARGTGCAIFQPVMPDDGPSVAILIPSRNHGARLKLAIDSLTKTTYRNYRIYVIDNESDDPETLRYLARCPTAYCASPTRPGGSTSPPSTTRPRPWSRRSCCCSSTTTPR